jgi:NAD(P)-dependent dehydrogenase (short-subunit alcohol dehydrogenase family)
MKRDVRYRHSAPPRHNCIPSTTGVFVMSATATYPSLAGRTIFVSGGGSGIGASVVLHFVRQKAKVGFVDIDETAATELLNRCRDAGGHVHFEKCDVRNIGELRSAIDATRRVLGPITVLVNNAARDDRHKTEDVTPEYWDERFAVNLKHQFFAAQAVLGDMKAAGGGSIINFGSCSWMNGQGGMVAYTACKSAATSAPLAFA